VDREAQVAPAEVVGGTEQRVVGDGEQRGAHLVQRLGRLAGADLTHWPLAQGHRVAARPLQAQRRVLGLRFEPEHEVERDAAACQGQDELVAVLALPHAVLAREHLDLALDEPASAVFEAAGTQHLTQQGAHAVGVLRLVPQHDEVDTVATRGPEGCDPQTLVGQPISDQRGAFGHLVPRHLALVAVEVQAGHHRHRLALLDRGQATGGTAVDVVFEQGRRDALVGPVAPVRALAGRNVLAHTLDQGHQRTGQCGFEIVIHPGALSPGMGVRCSWAGVPFSLPGGGLPK